MHTDDGLMLQNPLSYGTTVINGSWEGKLRS